VNRWNLVQSLFDETVDLDATSRARVLAERCGEDRDLARVVEELVAAEAAPLEALDGTAGDLWRGLTDDPQAEGLCGQSFGPYRVEEHLSSGGMGHVYRATRVSAGAERRVALKVLRAGLADDAFLARFQRERETLAALEHEHIVAFLDAGALPDGRPFLVMELVQGTPLTEWGRGVPVRARIELFLQVLAAVQYAHEKLVVHRDLKPSNVLVTPQGVPKLLDFGVAAVLAPGAAPGGGPDPLTPSHASPEQLRGAPAATAADVYSLGLLLHELLTGEFPSPEPVAAGRRPGLDRDLAAIVGRALEPEAARRYGSADRMAADLKRYLAREPVTARRATWLYRASLFVRRNLWPLALGAAAVAVLVAGLVGAELGRRRAVAESSAGWGAHGQAKAAARVLERWIVSAASDDPALASAAAASLEGALEDDLRDLPEAEVLTRITLARLYLDRGDVDRAARHAARAWELAQTTRGVGEMEKQRARELVERTR